MAIIGSLGDIVFEVSRNKAESFEDFGHECGARLNVTEIDGGAPLVSFLGPDVESISFTLRLASQLGVDPQSEYNRLQDYCNTGVACMLVMGGKPFGGSGVRWMIEKLSAAYKFFGKNGKPIWIDVNVSLKKYEKVNI